MMIFVFPCYLGTCMTFIGFWTNIKTLPSLHLYEHPYCKYLVQSHVRDGFSLWARIWAGQWLNRWGWCTEMEHSSAPVVVTYQRSHRALFQHHDEYYLHPGWKGSRWLHQQREYYLHMAWKGSRLLHQRRYIHRIMIETKTCFVTWKTIIGLACMSAKREWRSWRGGCAKH